MKDEMVIEQQKREINYLDREVKDLREIRAKLEEDRELLRKRKNRHIKVLKDIIVELRTKLKKVI